MNEREINRTFRNPTAIEAIDRIIGGDADVSPVPSQDVARVQIALSKLNAYFPGERRKRFGDRNPVFVQLRSLITEGNYDIFDRIEGRGDSR